jgi:hypothetical protein
VPRIEPEPELILAGVLPSLLRAQDRLAEAVNWRTIAFLLEGGVFLLMGLEVGPLVDDFRSQDGDLGRLVLLSAICLDAPPCRCRRHGCRPPGVTVSRTS